MHSKHYSGDYKEIFLALSILAAAILALGATTAYADTNDRDWENRDEARTIDVQLSGSREVPSVSTDTTGRYWLSFDEDGSDMTNRLDVYRGDEITAAHLHCAEPGENGPPVVTLFEDPSGTDVNGQIYSGSIRNGNIADADCRSTIGYDIDDVQDLARAVNDGKIYINVHSQSRPEGLIRADLPEGQRHDNDHDWNGSDDHDWKDDDHDGKNDWYKDRDGNWKDSCRDWSDDNRDGKHDWSNKEWDRWQKDHGSDWNDRSEDEHGKHEDLDDNNHDWEKDEDNRGDHDWKKDREDSDRGKDGRDGYGGRDGKDGNDNHEKRDDRWNGKESKRFDRSLSDITAKLGVRIGL